MIKKAKWLFLILLIISIVITIFLFINFIKEDKTNIDDSYSDNNNNKHENNPTDEILNDIINKEWYIFSLTISQNEEEYFRNETYDEKYIILDENTIKYCNQQNNKCTKDNYIYKDKILTIKTDNTLGSGNYTIKYLEDELILSRKEENKTITYSFLLP